MNAIEDNSFTQAWAKIGQRFPTPKAVLMISAHWMTNQVAVTAMQTPKTIHDFGGFPPALFAMQYPAPGSPELAARVAQQLAPVRVVQDQAWGLDHGAWSVLTKVYPEAQIPVVQLSLNMNEDPAFHYELGRQLSALRDEGVMLMGSGNVVHNLRQLNPSVRAYDWAERFDTLIRDTITAENFDQIVQFDQLGMDARLSIPTTEHFLPLLYVLGAKRNDDQTEVICNELTMGSISMTSYLFY
jgi:4,5-DOPA dioxygenase extradiol